MDSGIRKKVMESGAGIAVALVVILLFVLAATFLKSLVFGIIAAYFLLPLEKFFENRVFGSRMARRCASLAILLFSPFARLRDRLMRKKDPRSSGERMQARRERLVLNASLAAFLTCIGAVREILGAGEIFGFRIMPDSYVPFSIFVMAPGAFFVLATLTAIQNRVRRNGEKKGKDMSKIQSGCTDCTECSRAGCEHKFYDADANPSDEKRKEEGK